LGRENFYIPATGSIPVINVNQDEQINAEVEIFKSRAIAEKVLSEIGPKSLYPDPSLDKVKFSSLRDIVPCLRQFFHFLIYKTFEYLTQVLGYEKNTEKNALENLEKHIRIEVIKKSNVIEVSFEHPVPQIAADIVNSLVPQFFDRRIKVYRSAQSQDFFNVQSKFLEEKLNQTEAKLQALKEQYNVTDLKNQQGLMLKRIVETRSELEAAVNRELELTHRIENLRAQLSKLPKTIDQGEQSNPNEFLISNLEGRLAELQIEEQRLSAKYTDENRTLQSVRKEVALIRKQIADKEAKLYGRTSQGVSPTYLHLQEDQLRSEADLSSVKARRESLQQQLAAYERELAQLNQIETALNQLVQGVAVDRDNYRLYLTKSEESRISTAMDSEKIAGVSLLEPAHPPLKPVKPRVLLNLVLGLFLGIFGALGLALFVEFVSDDLERVEDVEAAFGLPVLSVIPELRKQTA
jgi:uncharacterized protein involved in exopolysaccharide biosynthesis